MKQTVKKQAKRIIAYVLVVIAVFAAMYARPVIASAANVSNETALQNLASSGGTAKLTADITLTSMLVVAEGKKLTIDLNGKTLTRGLTDCVEDGSVVYVSPGATLILNDTTNTNAGVISGGAAIMGGGIRNEGTTTVNGGRIVGNRAEEKGGGIYNGENAVLTLKGGVISGNEAKTGGGVYSAENATLELLDGSYNKLENGKTVKTPTSVTVTGNTADTGSGIYSGNAMSLSGGAELSGNLNGDDIYLADKVKITLGVLSFQKPAGLTTAGSGNTVVTEGFGANNTGSLSRYFFSADTSAFIRLTVIENGEVVLQKKPNTFLEVYEQGNLTQIIECDTPSTAWSLVSKYAKPNEYYFKDANSRISADKAYDQFPKWAAGDFIGWYDTVQNQIEPVEMQLFPTSSSTDPFVQAGYGIWEGYLKEDSQVKIILGSDWTLSERLSILRFNNVIIDLNGHTIKRDGKKRKNGNLFYLYEFAKLTILDSNPDSTGYKGIRGGVIADGNGDSCGGGFILNDYAELNILGGTVYNCITDEHGGAVYANDPRAKVILKNCAFDSCRTQDSGDDCHGGALYIRHTMQLTIENVTFRNCYSEDDGGAIYMDNRPGIVRMTNVRFENNEAKDRGGAIRVGSIDNDKVFLLEAVGCSFTFNKSGQDGGAIYFTDNDDSVYKNPAVFRDCVFSGNTGKNGSALKLNDNSVLLTSCKITGNLAKGMGAVYVDDGWTLSVAGKTVIRDNINADVILDKDGNSTRIYPAGLTEGAYIVINSDTNDKSTLMMKNADRNQLKYFHTATGGGKLEFTKTGTREANITFASLFGNGSLWVVIGIALLTVAAAIVIIFIKKRKGTRKDG